MNSLGDKINAEENGVGADLTGVYFDHEGSFDVKVRTKGATKREKKQIRRNARKEARIKARREERRNARIQERRDARKLDRVAERIAARRGLNKAQVVTDLQIKAAERGLLEDQTVSVEYLEGSTKSLSEIYAAISSGLPRFMDKYPDMQGVGYDPKDILINLYVKTSDTEQAVKAFATETFEYKVNVEISSGTVVRETVYGGIATTNVPGGDACMMSFVVKVGNTDGVLTAGHCDPRMRNSGFGNGSDLVLMSGRRLGGGTSTGGDVQIMTNDDYFSPTFFAGDGFSVRAVTGFRSRASTNEGVTSGSYVCKYSSQSGKRSCGRVKSTYFAPGVEYQKDGGTNRCSTSSGPSGLSCSLDYVQVVPTPTVSGDYPLETQGGDSGGPWFSNNTAFGVHGRSYKKTTNGPLAWAYYTPIDTAFGSLLNATLATY